MEINKLYSFVLLLILVGMVLGVGVLVLDKFSSTTFYTITGKMDSITPTNGSHTALSYGNITATTSVINATDGITFPASCYTVYANGTFFLNVENNATCVYSGYDLNVTYNAKDYATATRDATTSAGGEVSNISTNWLGLIVTVAILSIVLFLVVRSFGGGMRR